MQVGFLSVSVCTHDKGKGVSSRQWPFHLITDLTMLQLFTSQISYNSSVLKAILESWSSPIKDYINKYRSIP